MFDLQVAKTILRIILSVIMIIGVVVMSFSGTIMIVNMIVFITTVVGVMLITDAILDRMAK